MTKGSGRGASSSGEGPSPGAQKAGEKSKSGAVNKRMRTSLADIRVGCGDVKLRVVERGI